VALHAGVSSQSSGRTADGCVDRIPAGTRCKHNHAQERPPVQPGRAAEHPARSACLECHNEKDRRIAAVFADFKGYRAALSPQCRLPG